MCLTLTSGLHLKDLQISTRGRPLWRRFAGSFLCEHPTMCRSTVSIRETIRGKRWSTDRVILNAHLTYPKRRKPNILNAPKKVVAGCRNRSQGVPSSVWPSLTVRSAPKKALVGCRNRSQGVPSSVPVVRECEGSREEGGLEVEFGPHAFSEKKRILTNTRLLTCPGIVGASDRLYYRP